MLEQMWTEMYNDTWWGILYGVIIGGVGGLLLLAACIILPSIKWEPDISGALMRAMEAGASAAGKAARKINNPDGKG